MKSFEPGFIARQPISQELLQTVRLIGEYKGKQELFKEQAPQVLETLRQAAVIQSTESSNRIEGVTAPHDRIRQLVAEKTSPRDRSEQEIAGYRDVLNTIHANYADMRFTTGLVLQLHRDLYKFTSLRDGHWKPTDNQITETDSSGTKVVRFTPVSAFATADYMERLHERFDEALRSGKVEPLLLIPAYVLDFLCIHPFLDGNGRMARLLSLLLLYRAGYEVGRFVSLEQVVEQTKESYYDTLYQSSQDWHAGQHSLLPWWEYFLGVMILSAYREFERRVGAFALARGSKTALVLDAVGTFQGDFSVGDLQQRSPNVGIDLIRRVLRQEREAGRLQCLGRGPAARWRRA
jgi:Fic family protein